MNRLTLRHPLSEARPSTMWGPRISDLSEPPLRWQVASSVSTVHGIVPDNVADQISHNRPFSPNNAIIMWLITTITDIELL